MSQLLRLRLERPVHGGDVLAHDDGGAVFVRHGIAGELVLAKVVATGGNGRYRFAEVDQVLEPSTQRVPSVWPQAGPAGVGGGELGHVSRPGQRRWKELVIAEAFRRQGGLEQTVAVAAQSPDWELGTRTRVELSLDAHGIAGMHPYRAGEIIPVRDLPLAVPELRAAAELGRPHSGTRLRLIYTSTGERVILNGASSQRIHEQIQVGERTYHYQLEASSFWQAHRQAPQSLVSEVLSAAQAIAGEQVWDLYAGAGLFSVPLAAAGTELTSVEGDQRASVAAAKNLRRAGATASAIHSEVGRWLQAQLGSGASTESRVHTVVLDPPRKGAGKRVIDLIAQAHPERVIYVACDPVALARDSAYLQQGGYRLERAHGLDLFEHTHHVEIVASFIPR